MRQPITADTQTADPPGEETLARFPIAGVGASAGGLAATTELLRHLGQKPNIAVVIFHHLDPTHESSLAAILSRVSTLPVQAISDGMRVEPNHVYVVPPNADLDITDGKLNLAPRIETGGLHLPIDRFFKSLAADGMVHALGVVLSGTGFDGTSGIKAIKAEGGITFAQDASAEYRSMPESAIATGCVDFILPPEGIARELCRISERTPVLSADDDDDAAEFQRILSALRRSSRIDFANYKHTTLRRRVQRRVVVNGLPNLREYAELLQRSPDEIRALCDEVLIHVTNFFRDREMFDALRTTVFPKLLANRPRDTCIRVWAPGCSTGEEVYSIAISLLEFLVDAHAEELPVRLFGTDVSASAIDRARAGKYPASIENDVSAGRLEHFFSKTEGGYQIRKDVRDLCVFARQDVTRDPPFAGMDLISCRNLMIYLSPALQDRILPIFHYALKEPGFLVLGTSETIRSFPGFSTVDAKSRIFARTAAAPLRVFDFNDRPLAQPASHEVLAGAKQPGPLDVHREADRLVLAEFGPPGVVITDDLAIVQFRGRTGPYLEPAPGVASFALLRMVREELRLPLRQAIDEARAKGTQVRTTGLALTSGATPQSIEIEIIPFRVASNTQRYFVVLFRELTPAAVPRAATPVSSGVPSTVESQLGQELASTRAFLQSVIEQLEASNEELKAANEEIVASNEELRSTNEELQMAKEELQATNQELGTVNDEMTVRNVDATRLNEDLTNVLNSIEIPIVILGRDFRVRRFTPAAAKVFHLISSDIGRPIGDRISIISVADLKAMNTQVLEHLSAVVRTVQDEAGRWYQLTVRPYLTLDSRIDGTVVSAFDIDAMKKGAQLLSEAQKYAESIIDTVRECLVVLDAELRVHSVNRSFHQMFAVTDKEVEGRYLGELSRGEWDIPALRKQLEALGEGDMLEGYRVERDFAHAGRRVFMLNARRIEKTSLILLALEDVTETERVAQLWNEKLQGMAFDAALVEERERRRIAADLHDRIGQSLALAQIKLTSMRESVTGAPRDAVDQAVELLARSVADTRTLIFELSPPILYELGLREALSWLVEEVEKRHGLRIELTAFGIAKPLDDTTAALVFRAVRELLMNVIKHAKTSSASVSLRQMDDHLTIDVQDQGAGFDPHDIHRSSSGGGYGLLNIRDQIRRLGGKMEMVAAPGQGTRVSILVPLDPGEQPELGANVSAVGSSPDQAVKLR